jgi:hypothetical protein
VAVPVDESGHVDAGAYDAMATAVSASATKVSARQTGAKTAAALPDPLPAPEGMPVRFTQPAYTTVTLNELDEMRARAQQQLTFVTFLHQFRIDHYISVVSV